MLHQSYGVDLMDIAAGGHLDSGTTSWLAGRAESLRETLSAGAAGFFNQARTFYNMISTNDAIGAMRNIMVKTDNAWNTANIHSCTSIEQLQTANPVMQRYIMAHVDLRNLYLNNSVEGYSESYVNHHGNNVGEKQYDWRRVMDGIVVVEDDHARFTHYIEEIPEGEKELTLFEKVDILRTWNAIDAALDEDELDPTSPAGNML